MSYATGLEPQNSSKVGSESVPQGEDLRAGPENVSHGTGLEPLSGLDLGSGDASAAESLGAAPKDVFCGEGSMVWDSLSAAGMVTQLVVAGGLSP